MTHNDGSAVWSPCLVPLRRLAQMSIIMSLEKIKQAISRHSIENHGFAGVRRIKSFCEDDQLSALIEWSQQNNIDSRIIEILKS